VISLGEFEQLLDRFLAGSDFIGHATQLATAGPGQ
jgi:hypothetical protein